MNLKETIENKKMLWYHYYITNPKEK